MFDCSKPGVRVRLPIDEHVQVRSIDEKFNKSSEGLLGLMFDAHSFEAKNRVFEFNHR